MHFHKWQYIEEPEEIWFRERKITVWRKKFRLCKRCGVVEASEYDRLWGHTYWAALVDEVAAVVLDDLAAGTLRKGDEK